MKSKLFLLVMLFMVVFTACKDEESDEFCNNPEAACPDDTAIDATACCTDQNCYWTYNDQKMECNGDDCSEVLNAIVADACAAGITSMKSSDMSLEQLKAELQSVTRKLLAEARACSGCK